jgi:hypothetical protein
MGSGAVAETCRNCRFRKEDECRRHPPAKPPNFPDEPWRFPVVGPDAWCGEWKPAPDLTTTLPE